MIHLSFLCFLSPQANLETLVDPSDLEVQVDLRVLVFHHLPLDPEVLHVQVHPLILENQQTLDERHVLLKKVGNIKQMQNERSTPIFV
jgi:hypothetical protein